MGGENSLILRNMGGNSGPATASLGREEGAGAHGKVMDEQEEAIKEGRKMP